MNSSIFRLSTFETGQYADFREIICFVADRNYTLIYLNDGRILVASKCLECLEQHVPKHSFIRIHKSYLINPHFVTCLLADKQLQLINGAVYPVSRRKWRQTRLHFKQKKIT